jgi:NAD(P)-dependent dehydrogenase (short-subunit alcohol dehydrogenase family)
VPGRLEDKVAVVTGAASGIGLGVARRFVAEGAAVVLGDIDVPGLEGVTEELGPLAASLPTDVTDEDHVAALCELALSRFGHLDVAIANAGAGHYAPIVDHSLADWQRILDLCLTGVFLTVKHAALAMTRSDRARPASIVAIASMNAVQPAAGMAAYCTAKAGVSMLAQVAAMELGPSGIRVNAIAPGLVQTGATGAFFDLPGVVDDFVANTAVKRFATPDDVASLAVYLASDESSFVSASTYLIDGGGHTGRYPVLAEHFARLAAPGAGHDA